MLQGIVLYSYRTYIFSALMVRSASDLFSRMKVKILRLTSLNQYMYSINSVLHTSYSNRLSTTRICLFRYPKILSTNIFMQGKYACKSMLFRTIKYNWTNENCTSVTKLCEISELYADLKMTFLFVTINTF